jgi:signal transduction histidine kinase
LPDFRQLDPVRSGIATSFDEKLASRAENVGLEFIGYLDIPKDGSYTFTTRSDDGSRLEFGDLSVRILNAGVGAWPAPRQIFIGQGPAPEEDGRWSEIEGAVRRVTRQISGWKVELSADSGAAQAELLQVQEPWPELLLHSKLKLRGVWQSILADSPGDVIGRLLVPDAARHAQFVSAAPEYWTNRPAMFISALLTNRSLPADTIVLLRGTIHPGANNSGLFLEDASGRIRLDDPILPGNEPFKDGDSIELLGCPRYDGPSPAVWSLVRRSIESGGQLFSASTPHLTKVSQVRQLDQQAAGLELATKLRGVLIWLSPEEDSVMLQDETGGIYVDDVGLAHGERLELADFVEIEGVAEPGEFAPVVRCSRVTRLGRGTLPEPAHPSWDQLMNGSMDSQYSELEGSVTSVLADGFRLFLREGPVRVVLDRFEAGSLRGYENARVSIRGALGAHWDAQTHKVKSGQVGLLNAGISVIERAPHDLFSTRIRQVDELRRFDSQADPLSRVKVSGQVSNARRGEGYLFDGSNGLHFYIRNLVTLQAGDQVEAVGFPRLEGPLVVLREAVVRRVGQAPLPPPRRLTEQNLLNSSNDSMLVVLEGQLVAMHSDAAGQTLELQLGTRTFLAKLARTMGTIRGLRLGSRLKLTGAYVRHFGEVPADQELEAFELLLNSPGDIVVLRRPSWWTAGRALALVGGLLGTLLLAAGWISSLRRRVERRTWELQEEIEGHKRTESQLADEIEERKRVEQRMEKTHNDLVVASREAGMAEVASGVLHNVGNVLNSVNVSASVLLRKVRSSKVDRVSKAAALLRQHQADITSFLRDDSRGKQLTDYVGSLGAHLVEEQQAVLEELRTLDRNVGHIKQIVSMQQGYAKLSGLLERVQMTDLLEDAIRVNSSSLDLGRLELVREYPQAMPEVLVDRHQVLQIVVNLLRNAIWACGAGSQAHKQVTLHLALEDAMMKVEVADNGIGITSENLARIFNFGFTTRKDGHGYGLHSGALAAKGMGGSLAVHSDGPNRGAIFTLEIPVAPQSNDAALRAPSEAAIAIGH